MEENREKCNHVNWENSDEKDSDQQHKEEQHREEQYIKEKVKGSNFGFLTKG